MRSLGKWLFSVVRQPAVWIPALLLIAATSFFRLTDADLTIFKLVLRGAQSVRQSGDGLAEQNHATLVGILRLGSLPGLGVGMWRVGWLGGEFLLGPAAVVARPRAVSRSDACDWPRCDCQWRVQAILGTAAPARHDPLRGRSKTFCPFFRKVPTTTSLRFLAAMPRWASTSWPQRLSSIAASHGWRRHSCVWG